MMNLIQIFISDTMPLLTTAVSMILVRLARGQLQFYYSRDHRMIDQIINVGNDFWDRFDGIKNGHDYWYPPKDTKRLVKYTDLMDQKKSKI